jgi:hypothetical protein
MSKVIKCTPDWEQRYDMEDYFFLKATKRIFCSEVEATIKKEFNKFWLGHLCETLTEELDLTLWESRQNDEC